MGIPTGRSSSETRPDVLFVFLPGLAQVCVHINECRQEQFAVAFDHARSR